MYRSTSFRIIVAALLISAVCATVFSPNARAQSLEDDDMTALQQPPTSMQATDVQLRMNALENLVRALTGQVEKLQFHNNQLMQAQQKSAGDYDIRFKDIEQKIATHDAGLKGLVAAQQQLAEQSQQAQTTPPPPPEPEQTTPSIDAPQSKESAKDKPSNTLGTITKDPMGNTKIDPTTAQAHYDQAFNALRQAKYDDAEKSFSAFLKNHPKHALTENAKYWLAETFYVRDKFQEAAVAFADAYQEFPKGTKAPDNLLKLSMSLASLGKKQDACVTLSELIKKFPQASATTKNRAEQQKKALGCS